MTTTNLHSRSVLAGYDPDVLNAAKVLVVGLGALGQNVVQNLALVGVGQLMLVDFDEFEGHNATRSPFYPTRAEIARFGRGKASVVAHRTARISTAQQSAVYYAPSLIQALGDGALAWADIVVAAVDSVSARAWLAERCKLLARPMVEGGFSGPHFNLSAFAPTAESACYRCGHPGRESSTSCTAYALAAERANVVPAIQTTAAVLGGYQAERVIQLLHGSTDHFDRRSYGNVRRETMLTALLAPAEDCPGIHIAPRVIGTVSGFGETSDISDLVAAVSEQFGGGRLRFAERVVARLSCTVCRTPCKVQATESSWLVSPRCSGCGGPWPTTDLVTPDGCIEIGTDDELSAELAGTRLVSLGLRPAASLMTWLRDGRSGLLTIDGDILGCLERADPEDKAALDL